MENSDERDYRRWANGDERKRKIQILAALNGFGASAHFVNMMIEIGVGVRFNMELPVVSREIRNATDPDSPLSFQYYYINAGWVPITWYVFMIHVLSFCFHIGILSFLVHDLLADSGMADWYLKGIFRCRAPWRWAEYTLSASLQMYVMALTMGIRDVQLLLAVTILCATTITFGWVCEICSSRMIVTDEKNNKKRLWEGEVFGEQWFDRVVWSHAIAYMPYVAMFTIIIDTFYKHRNAMGDAYPEFMDWIVVLTVLGFTSFGVIQSANQLFRNGPDWYFYGEVGYVVMSFLAKAQLVLIISFQALVPGAEFDEQLGARFT